MTRTLRAVPVVGLLLLACGSGPQEEEESAAVLVTEVVDGDTFDVQLADEAVERVRIVGINAPESGECFADEATTALSRLVAEERVTLVVDVSDRDQYGRLLRYIDAGGVDVGEALVSQGYAVVRVSEPDTTREALLRVAQSSAQDRGAGLWASDACGEPDDAAAGSVRIVRLRLDADGPDGDNLNDEWVEIANTGDEDVALTGWVVRDESSSHRFGFPRGFTLAAEARVRIRTGCGTATRTELFWCETGSAVWNNDGDTAFLLDPNGNVVDNRAAEGPP